MILRNRDATRKATWLALVASGAMCFGMLESCENRLITLTDYVDPCGTILGDCNPGDFQVGAAQVGDYCIDPACTVPGQCDNEGQPLGTITDLCP